MLFIIWIKPSCLKSNFQPHRLWSSVPPFSSSTPSTDPSSTRCSTGSAPSWSSCPSSSSSSWQIASLKLGPSSSYSPTWADAAQPSSLRSRHRMYIGHSGVHRCTLFFTLFLGVKNVKDVHRVYISVHPMYTFFKKLHFSTLCIYIFCQKCRKCRYFFYML